jgi:hypothetical protein
VCVCVRARVCACVRAVNAKVTLSILGFELFVSVFVLKRKKQKEEIKVLSNKYCFFFWNNL